MTSIDVEDVKAKMSGRWPSYLIQFTQLMKKGNEWRGPCALHGGDGPNLAVNPETGTWFCHSRCRRGGDTFSFMQELKGWSFAEALEDVTNFAQIPSKPSLDRLRKMDKAGIPLGDYVNKQLYRGLVTGFNAAFYIDDKKKSELIATDPKSAEIIKPLLVGDNVRRWRTEQKKWVIATNVGVEIERYPTIFAYLSGFQQQLEDRWDKGKHWWELRSCVYYAAFEKSKIVYPDIGKEPRFTLDASGCYLDATATCIGSADLYLLGLLNSPTVWSYIAEKCSVLGDAGAGGRIRLKTFYVERVPIPNASEADRAAIAALVQHCLDAKGVGCGEWEAEIDGRVAALYGL